MFLLIKLSPKMSNTVVLRCGQTIHVPSLYYSISHSNFECSRHKPFQNIFKSLFIKSYGMMKLYSLPKNDFNSMFV